MSNLIPCVMLNPYYNKDICNMYVPSKYPKYLLVKIWHIYLVMLGCTRGIHHIV